VLVHTHDGRVDHLEGRIMSSRERVHDAAPDPGASPTHKAVAPGCAGPKHPIDTIQNTIIYSRTPRALFGNLGLMAAPFILLEFVAHDFNLSFCRIESRRGPQVSKILNHGRTAGAWA
jgi:hypothetical protein